MCIIAFKPAGTKMPEDDEIEHMFTHNKDGAGYAIQGNIGKNGGFTVKYSKGYMTIKDLLNAIHAEGDLTKYNVAIHCRIGTAGKNDQATTHPFPISTNYNNLRKLEGKGQAILFHNGVMSGLGGKLDKLSSDTQDFVATMGHAFLRRAKMPSEAEQAAINAVIGTCRLLIMYPNPHFPVLRFGTWHEHKGVFYSNEGYKGAPTYYGYSSYYSDYDSYYRTHKQQSNKDSYYIDSVGRNIAKFAYPNSINEWIRCTTTERYNTIIRSATMVEDLLTKEGYQIVKFTYSNKDLWCADPENLEIFRATRIEDWKAVHSIETELLKLNIDPDDHIIFFEDMEQALEWTQLAKHTGSNTFKLLGREWWFDDVMLEAYDEEGLRTTFSTGQQGHVKRYIEKEGTYSNHQSCMNDALRFYDIPEDEDLPTKEELDKLFPDEDLKLLDDGIRKPDSYYQGA